MRNVGVCKAYLGLGANLRDPVEQIISARSELSKLPGVSLLACSRFYMSSPVGNHDQPNFINCVFEVETSLSAIDLLDATQKIETDLGRLRVAGNQNAPRLIDIDLLLYGSQHINNERLIVPHPRMADRLFVLRPLLELNDSLFYKDIMQKGTFKGQQLIALSMK